MRNSAKNLERRKVLQGGAALAMASLAVGAGTKPAHAHDEALKDLWQRFIEIERSFGDAAKAEDEASFAAHLEESELPLVWRYFGPPDGCIATIIGASEKQDRPLRSLADIRFTPYPTARNQAEARQMSLAREAREKRARNAKLGWIRRKHRLVELEQAAKVAHDATIAIRRLIAEVPADCPLANAIKLAVWAFDEDLSNEGAPPPYGHGSELEAAQRNALWSAYAGAVRACGFDPHIVANKALKRIEHRDAA